MPSQASRPTSADLDPNKLITARQYRFIKLCSAENLVRAESVARVVVGRNLCDLTQLEAHQVIQYLERCCYEPVRSTEGVDFNVELGLSLARVNQRSGKVTDTLCVLALLATNRVATPGQLARYVYGVEQSTYGSIRRRIAPLLEGLLSYKLVARAQGISVPVLGKDAVTDVYFLTEWGSEALHNQAPHINYYARPGLPPPSRVQHELAVTEARLCIQTTHHIEDYEPESSIRGEREKERRKRKRQGGEFASKHADKGLGDFRAWVVNVDTNEGRRVEVEVTIRARQQEIISKPNRIKSWFAATQHRCDLLEWCRGEFANIIPDFREPLDEVEKAAAKAGPIAKWSTVSSARLERVGEALERLGGVGTPEALAVVAGLKTPTVSEALACLAAKGEVEYRDGFPAPGKRMGRNLRLYLRKGIKIHSIFEFSRLLTASKLISSRALNRLSQNSLQPTHFDVATGVLILSSETVPVFIAVIDDLTDRPRQVALWALAAYRQAVCGVLSGLRKITLDGKGHDKPSAATKTESGRSIKYSSIRKDQLIIATSDQTRAEIIQLFSDFEVLNVERVS